MPCSDVLFVCLGVRGTCFFDQNKLLPLYKALVRSCLEYYVGLQAWRQYLNKHIELLEKVQKE